MFQGFIFRPRMRGLQSMSQAVICVRLRQDALRAGVERALEEARARNMSPCRHPRSRGYTRAGRAAHEQAKGA